MKISVILTIKKFTKLINFFKFLKANPFGLAFSFIINTDQIQVGEHRCRHYPQHDVA
jgi:hypothetical protein